MPVPPPDKVTELIGDVVAGFACDLEGVTVSAAGRRSVVRIIVDSEDGLELDEVAELSRAISAVLDATPGVADSSYTLEVTTPGVDRPLTLERHWRRARGRRVAVTLEQEKVSGRVGEVVDGTVTLVLTARPQPQVRTVALADVRSAVVEVEFSRPDPAELAITGAPRGAVPGEPVELGEATGDTQDDDTEDHDTEDTEDTEDSDAGGSSTVDNAVADNEENK
ncbi:ribosome maturation factor RimP [Rhodococcus sp. X156]|uniref:ribosome maturation factor RimP n=1 Tax=Rhodococcus sp. X156 TaxID=2499145 RepID=UPI000FDB6C3F|nr:ribosome maturation factor RimP [Rhodococcus sp. X156]